MCIDIITVRINVKTEPFAEGLYKAWADGYEVTGYGYSPLTATGDFMSSLRRAKYNFPPKEMKR